MARSRGRRQDDEVTHEIGSGSGPYDIDHVKNVGNLADSHLDLGAVLVPVVEGGQVTVEMSADHQPQNVFLVTPLGRISVDAFAAPRSPGLWREVVTELVESLKSEGANTAIEDGFWGREIVAQVPGGQHRFIGVDGPRWMIRAVASGPDEHADDLTSVARAVVSETVVRRGSEPHPPRTVLPIVLPPVLAEQVAAAQQQMAQEEADAHTNGVPGAASSDFAEPAGAQAQVAAAEVVAEESEPSETEDVGGPDADVAIAEDDAVENGDDEVGDTVAVDTPPGAGAQKPTSSAMQQLRKRFRR